MQKLLTLVAALSLVACGAAPLAPLAPVAEAAPVAETSPPEPAEPEDTCVGQVDPPPAGLSALDEEPPGFALGAPGKGSLCEAEVFVAKGRLVVYRLFSASYETTKRAGPLGAYWALDRPSGRLSDYRTEYAICTEWNDLDMLNECEIKPGAEVVIGPGQSATCADGSEYPQSAKNQALIVKTADGAVPVTDCKQSTMEWAP